MAHLRTPDWAVPAAQARIAECAERTAQESPGRTQERIEELARESHRIHDVRGINLNPATNVLNPRAEALLASGMGSRPSLGHPGDKYEMGLQAIEEIEVATAELACEVFGASHAEYRVASGALANLYAFLATCEPGDTIIAPPPTIGGHVTHHAGGSAGMYRLTTVSAPIDADAYTIDVDRLRDLAHEVKPRMITVGGSLNLFQHPVSKVRAIADEVGALVLFDAAHQCGLIAGGVWDNPLRHGAHIMTMSTYKSLGGPAGGLILTDDDEIARRLDAIAYPGLTANFDAAKTAALGVTLADWKAVGPAYARAMVELAAGLARELDARGVPVYARERGFTDSHQFAVEAARYGGGQSASRQLERSGLLACGIGLPRGHVEGDLAGLRIGTPELARIGMAVGDMPELAALIARALDGEVVADEVASLRSRFAGVHFTVDNPA